MGNNETKKKSDFDAMLNKFKEQCIADGLFEELRKREYYLGPSARRKRKDERARKRRLK